MSAFLPAPSMIVVFSFSMRTFLALPSMSSVTFSSLMPRSSLITWPPVRMARSSSIDLRRSPKPGAFTAATLSPPRSLLTTSVASASPSMSSATISSGLPLCTTASSKGRIAWRPDSFFSNKRMYGLFELADHLLGIGDEVGREVAAVELHALDDVEFGFEALRLLDRDDALVADLVHRLRDHLADLAVVIGRDRPDLGDLGVGRDLFRDLLDVADDRCDGHVDAALQIHRVHAGGNRLDPSRTIAWASTVAVVVPSPA